MRVRNGGWLALACLGLVGAGYWMAGGAESRSLALAADEPKGTSAHVMAETPEAAGRYIVSIAGCNDCHTPGFLMNGGNVPESEWLTGDPIGWRGPWGTTYASNLRLYVDDFSEDVFVKMMRTRNAKPPMPWASLHAMSDADLRAVYRYIKSMGPKGEKMPDYVPPDQEPKTPYLNMVPVMPK